MARWVRDFDWAEECHLAPGNCQTDHLAPGSLNLTIRGRGPEMISLETPYYCVSINFISLGTSRVLASARQILELESSPEEDLPLR